MSSALTQTPARCNSYFLVPDIDAAKTAIEAHGGQVVHGPMEVPGGEWILNAIDPQGAFFCLASPPK